MALRTTTLRTMAPLLQAVRSRLPAVGRAAGWAEGGAAMLEAHEAPWGGGGVTADTAEVAPPPSPPGASPPVEELSAAAPSPPAVSPPAEDLSAAAPAVPPPAEDLFDLVVCTDPTQLPGYTAPSAPGSAGPTDALAGVGKGGALPLSLASNPNPNPNPNPDPDPDPEPNPTPNQVRAPLSMRRCVSSPSLSTSSRYAYDTHSTYYVATADHYSPRLPRLQP